MSFTKRRLVSGSSIMSIMQAATPMRSGSTANLRVVHLYHAFGPVDRVREGIVCGLGARGRRHGEHCEHSRNHAHIGSPAV